MVNTNLMKGAIAEAGYTQTTLAKEANMSLNSMNAKVNGLSDFTGDEIDCLCDILGIVDPRKICQIFLPKVSQKWDGVKE